MDGKPIEEVNSQSSQLNEEGFKNLWATVEIIPVVAPWPAGR